MVWFTVSTARGWGSYILGVATGAWTPCRAAGGLMLGNWGRLCPRIELILDSGISGLRKCWLSYHYFRQSRTVNTIFDSRG